MAKLMQCSKNRQELLNNTVNHFNLNNRGFSLISRTCMYRVKKNGEVLACAIGRELSDTFINKLSEKCLLKGTVEKIFPLLPIRLQRMGKYFLMHIQDLHDNECYWNENGLSDFGKAEVATICRMYKLNNPLIN